MKTKTTSSLQRFSFSALPLFSFFLFFLAVQPATAASFTWVAGGATGNWGDNANWNSPPTFNNANDFVFNGIVNNISFLGAANRTINGLTFADSFTSAGAYRLNTYSTAGSTGGSNRNLIFAGTDAFITVGSMANVGTPGIFLGQSGLGNVQLNDNLAVAVNSTDLTKRLIFDSVVSQSGGDRSITKTGTGAIVLQRANTFSGGVNIDEGVVIAQANPASLGTGAVNLGAVAGADNATLQLGANTANAIVVNTGDGTRTLQNNTFGNVNRTQSGNITLNKDLTSDVQNLSATANGMTLSGVISGAGGINQIGNGTLILSNAANSFGGLQIDAGQVALQTNATVTGLSGSGGGLSLAGGALTVNNTNTTTNASEITGTGSLTKSGAGTVTLTGSNSYSGLTTVSAGTLLTTSDASLAGYTTPGNVVFNGGTIGVQVGGAGWTTNQVETMVSLATKTSGQLGIDTSNGDLAQWGAVPSIAIGLAKLGLNTFTLNDANAYAGATTVRSGTLELDRTGGESLGSTASVTVDSGALLLISQSDQVRDAATVTLSGGTIRRGGNVSEVFGNLDLTTTSFLDYGAGNDAGTIRFGTYTPSALLTVQNFLPGNKLQFGNTISSTDLNNATLFSFSNDFTTGTESGFFTITAIPEPSTCLAGAGLLAMLLWPARRRLLKKAQSVLGLRCAGEKLDLEITAPRECA